MILFNFIKFYQFLSSYIFLVLLCCKLDIGGRQLFHFRRSGGKPAISHLIFGTTGYFPSKSKMASHFRSNFWSRSASYLMHTFLRNQSGRSIKTCNSRSSSAKVKHAQRFPRFSPVCLQSRALRHSDNFVCTHFPVRNCYGWSVDSSYIDQQFSFTDPVLTVISILSSFAMCHTIIYYGMHTRC